MEQNQPLGVMRVNHTAAMGPHATMHVAISHDKPDPRKGA